MIIFIGKDAFSPLLAAMIFLIFFFCMFLELVYNHWEWLVIVLTVQIDTVVILIAFSDNLLIEEAFFH